ncbi:MAG: hypothetical protein J7J76_08435 [Candidatus Latescibacteria bacterium]|nr:hypothetical protein [Candidatus Latescibacterota bacterium]
MFRARIADVAALLGAMVLFAGTAMAATITVDDDGPADYSSIREAVEAASEGDTVFVKPGTYTVTREPEYGGGIEMKEALVLQGAGADSTFIKPDLSARPWELIYFNGASAEIDGFTMSYPDGEAIFINMGTWQTGRMGGPTWVPSPNWAPPTITNNKIVNSRGAIVIYYNPGIRLGTINGNTITGNRTGIFIAVPRVVQSQRGTPYALDLSWNWWGTAVEYEIEATLTFNVPSDAFIITWRPWLTEPISTFAEAPGVHYNNIYANQTNIEMGILWLEVEGLSWGVVKSRFR